MSDNEIENVDHTLPTMVENQAECNQPKEQLPIVKFLFDLLRQQQAEAARSKKFHPSLSK